MKLKKIRSAIGRNWHNIPGWRTNRKIVVFESDDWGSIRTPSREVYEFFREKGYPVKQRPFESYDALESEEDIIQLFNVLKRHSDKKGKYPVFTANYIMTNPDFNQIKNSSYLVYHSEPFFKTLQQYAGSKDVLNLIRQGLKEQLFFPQYHGINHFNTKEWLRLLQQGEADTLMAFQHRMVGITPKDKPQLGNQLMVALRYDIFSDLEDQKKEISEGCKLFENIFGYRTRSFIAPVYTWSKEIEPVLKEEGIDFIQGGRYQLYAAKNKEGQKKKAYSWSEKQIGSDLPDQECIF